MKHFLLPVLFLLVAGCAAPTYTYRFAPSPYLASMGGKNHSESLTTPGNAGRIESSEEHPVLVAAAETPASVIAPPETPAGRKLKKVVRKLKEQTQSLGERLEEKFTKIEAPAPAGVDNDLKLAVILGAAGIVSLLLLVISQVFGIIGGIALIAAVIYFAKWVINQ
ncbi:MAG: hypothetical protein ACKO3B_01600 [Bacteroidota bacterium]